MVYKILRHYKTILVPSDLNLQAFFCLPLKVSLLKGEGPFKYMSSFNYVIWIKVKILLFKFNFMFYLFKNKLVIYRKFN